MKKATVQISFPAEKMGAIQHYMAEKGGDLNGEMEDALQRIYDRIVPKEVRAYLEVKAQATPTKPPRTHRPAPSAASSGNDYSQGGQSE
ncbi:DUF6103 family protein [Ruminococcaceae bacterium OttesenSCG-928-L11]|nr:DUF6103 family protein [Ruminococcaceae bacterium OttesenSCG-928-L11]